VPQHAAPDDANVLGTVHHQFAQHHGAGGEIDGAVGGYLDFAGLLAHHHVLHLVHARAKVNEAGMADEDIVVVALAAVPVDAAGFAAGVGLGKGGIGEEVEVVLAVATKLQTQIGGLEEGEDDGAVIDDVGSDVLREGTHDGLGDALVLGQTAVHDTYRRGPGHVEQGKTGLLHLMHINVATVGDEVGPGLGTCGSDGQAVIIHRFLRHKRQGENEKQKREKYRFHNN